MKPTEMLRYVLFLVGFFVLLELSYFVLINKAYLTDFHFVTSNLTIPRAVLPGAISFLLAQVATHLCYAVSIWWIALSLTRLFSFSPMQSFNAVITLTLLGLVTIMLANQYYFPNTLYAALTNIFISVDVTKILFPVLLLFWVVILFLSFFYYLFISKKHPAVVVLALIALVPISHQHQNVNQAVATAEKPNVFIVGVDSLRPDFLGYFGSDVKTPFINHFLQRSNVFTDALTPLARTYPSWSVILSGQFPMESGIRTNLAKQDKINILTMLPVLMQQHGYQTIYATDEVRFANFNKQFGFDILVTPPMGLNDFLIGSLNDFPMSNLLINTPVGEWLFPYNYANRPAYVTYQPTSFIKRVLASLKRRDSHKPVFMAIHFCLPHQPYLWSEFDNKSLSMVERYERSIERVDMQLADFFKTLQDQHLLDHAIVVLLSDHGEALAMPGDRITDEALFVTDKPKSHPPQFFTQRMEKESFNVSLGHGTDVLGLAQYHTLLAFRFFGVGDYPPKQITGLVSLQSIKPTLLECLFRENAEDSLAKYIFNKKPQEVARRHIFLENDYTPEVIQTLFPNMHDVVLEGVKVFEIDPVSTHLFMRNSMQAMIMQSKQLADVYGDWMLALYPQQGKPSMPILVNLKTGRWSADLQSAFAKKAPVSPMIAALRSHYHIDIFY